MCQQEYVEKTKTKAKKEKNIALPQSVMEAKLGGTQFFEKAKLAGDIHQVIDDDTGEIFWAYRTMSIESKEEVRHGGQAGGSHKLDVSQFREIQAYILAIANTHYTHAFRKEHWHGTCQRKMVGLLGPHLSLRFCK